MQSLPTVEKRNFLKTCKFIGYVYDLDGNTISNSSDAISKWSPIDNLGVQQDDTNILLTFDLRQIVNLTMQKSLLQLQGIVA